MDVIFATTVFLLHFVAPATIGAMAMAAKHESKAGLLIQFMFFKIPIKEIKLRAKVRLILLNKRIPYFFARTCQISPVIDKINPACF